MNKLEKENIGFIKTYIEFLDKNGEEKYAELLRLLISMNKEERDDFISKSIYLHNLHQCPQLPSKNIDKAIKKGFCLFNLYRTQKLNKKQKDQAINKGECLDILRKYQKLTPQQKEKIKEKLNNR